jgi:hypothetical protein
MPDFFSSKRCSLKFFLQMQGIISFAINLIVLWSVFTPPWKGALAGTFKQTLPLTATVAFIAAGASYTGPAMNPVTVSHYLRSHVAKHLKVLFKTIVPLGPSAAVINTKLSILAGQRITI